MGNNIYKDIIQTAALESAGSEIYSYTRVAFDWGSSEKAIIDACRTPENYRCLDGSIKAVYVISADDRPYSKIGITSNPQDRCCGLQTANWDRLHVRFVLWVWDEQALLVEQLALDHARNLGHEVRGEWVGLASSEAFSLVIQSAAVLDVDAGDMAAIGETKRQMVLCAAQHRERLMQEAKAEKFARLGY